MKRYQVVILSANAALSLVIIILASILLFRGFSGAEPGGVDYESDFEELKMYFDDLTAQNQELAKKLEAVSKKLDQSENFGTDTEIRVLLPKSYVEQIDSFFEEPRAQGLLSEKASARGVWKFGKPRLLSPDLLTVDYTFAGQTETLLVSLKALDYADLEFKVIWDSFDIRR